jgi:AsmA protein
MKKPILIAVAAVAALAVVLFLGAILFLDANQFRPQLETAMTGALGRKVSIGNVKTAVLSGGVALEDLSIADDPAFSSAPFVTAKSVSVGVDMTRLLVSRRLLVKSFRLEGPEVTLISSPSGQWNFSGLAAAASSSAPGERSSSPAAPTDVTIQQITIADGRVTIARAGGAPATTARTYDRVSVEVSDVSLTSQFPFRLTATTPGGGTVALEGRAGPFNAGDAADTPFEAMVDATGLDVAASGFVDPASGLAGKIGFTGSMTSDGERLTSKGTLTADAVRLVPQGTPAQVPIELDYATDYNRKTKTGRVNQGDVHVGRAVARLAGDYSAAGDTIAVRLTLSGNQMPASELEAMLHPAGVTLPAGASLEQGSLDLNLAISGPLDRLVIAGPINLTNVTLRGFDLAGRLSALPLFSALPKGGDTAIQTLAVTVRVAPDGIQADRLNVVAPSVGTLTGAGTIAPGGALDLKMMAEAIPFLVQGTTANPEFKPDVRRAMTDLVKNPEAAKKAATAVGGLFRR